MVEKFFSQNMIIKSHAKISGRFSAGRTRRENETKTQLKSCSLTCQRLADKNRTTTREEKWDQKMGWKVFLLPAKGVGALVTQRPLACSVPASQLLSTHSDLLDVKDSLVFIKHFLWYYFHMCICYISLPSIDHNLLSLYFEAQTKDLWI